MPRLYYKCVFSLAPLCWVENPMLIRQATGTLNRVRFEMDNSLITLLKDWVFPIGSILLSVWYASSAKKDAERSERILAQITSAVDGWQKQIMNSATNILDSQPQVLEGRLNAARMQAVAALIPILKEAYSNQNGLSSHGHETALSALTAQLTVLLSTQNERDSKT